MSVRAFQLPADPGEAGEDAVARELLSLALGDTQSADDLLQQSERGAAALVPREAARLAVISSDGAAWVEPQLLDLLPDLGEHREIRALAAKARQRGLAQGALTDGAGAALLACALVGPAARAWARSDDAVRALERPGAVLLLVFAPGRSSNLATRATAAFGLTPSEARIAEAFLFAPTLEVAAEQCGVSRVTARDAMGRITAKMGVRRSADVVRRLTEMMCGADDSAAAPAQVLREVFGLTPAESGVATELARGATQKEAAEALGLSPETVRGYAKSVLVKARAPRLKDFVRLAAEACALDRLAHAAEPVFTSGEPSARLRLLAAEGGRNLAFLDYGPASARPALMFHGFVAGRSLPPALVRALHARGLRPLVPQRPGFGLTSPANGDYLQTAASDLELLVARLSLSDVLLFARDGGTAAALAFASKRATTIRRAVLLNPRRPGGVVSDRRTGPAAQLSRFLLERPQLIEGFAGFIRRRSRTQAVQRLIREGLTAVPSDVAAVEDPAVLAQLARDVQAQFAHSSAGYVAEHSLYACGWSPPPLPSGPAWVLLYSGPLGAEPETAACLGLPQASVQALPRAGVLAQFTHAEAIAAALAG